MKYFQRFNDVTDEYLRTDKHMHTTWTDGQSTVAEMAHQAQKMGLTCIAITDHIRKNSTYFNDYHDEIRRLNHEYDVEILVGFEAKVTGFCGAMDVDPKVAGQSDIRVASVHRFPLGRNLYAPDHFDKKTCQEIELELAMAAIRRREANVLGHPGGMSLRKYGEFPLEFFDEIIQACAEHEMAFDFNCSYHSHLIEDLKAVLGKHNPFVSFGSDAHHRDKLGGWLKLLRINGRTHDK
jgi:putative hydrolase